MMAWSRVGRETGQGKGNMMREEEEQVVEGRDEGWETKGPVCSAVLTDFHKLWGTTGYTTSKLSPHHPGEEKARVEEGREGVGDARGPVCSAALTDLPKLRAQMATSPPILTPHHLSGGVVWILSLLTNMALFQGVSFSYIHCICLIKIDAVKKI